VVEKRKNKMEKESVLGLAITIKDGKTESKMKAKGINPFEMIGLLMSQIININSSINKTIKKEEKHIF